MKVKAANPFGYEDWMTCRAGTTETEAPEHLSDDEVLAVAKRSVLMF